MRDEKKLCANCHHEHAWGILRYSMDNTPLYGARECEERVAEGRLTKDNQGNEYSRCPCDRFVAAIPGMENLPALSQKDAEELWSKTSFLNAQVPAATRMIVANIMSIGQGDKKVGFWGKLLGRNDKATSLMERQWPEFMGFMISQVTDIRGAMIRDESKFAHLVAHTDEVVESMRAVSQLAERLHSMYALNERMAEQIEKLTDRVKALQEQNDQRDKEDPLWQEYQRSLCGSCRHQKAAHQDDEADCTVRDCGCTAWCEPASFTEAAKVFASTSAPLRNEPIPTDANHIDDEHSED